MGDRQQLCRDQRRPEESLGKAEESEEAYPQTILSRNNSQFPKRLDKKLKGNSPSGCGGYWGEISAARLHKVSENTIPVVSRIPADAVW